MKLPLLDMTLSDTKLKMLKGIEKSGINAKDQANKLGVHLSLIYANLKSMQRDGLLDDKLKITENGRLRMI